MDLVICQGPYFLDSGNLYAYFRYVTQIKSSIFLDQGGGAEAWKKFPKQPCICYQKNW